MKELKTEWLTEGLIDFEFKKYQLLAYLKNVQKLYAEKKLYPHLRELVFHYNNILSLQTNKRNWVNNFPNALTKIDLENIKLHYEKIIQDNELMKELNDIMEFAIPNIKQAVIEGKDIYEFVESTLSITSVGLSPIYKDEGYFFIHQSGKREMSTYRYSLRIFESPNDSFRGIEASFLGRQKYRKFTSLKSEKMDLVKRYKELPNPATYFITTTQVFPFEETLLPVVKQCFVRYVSSSSEDNKQQ